MRHPKSVSKAFDVLYCTFGGTLNRARIVALIANYDPDTPVEIRAICYDGTLKLGAWVNCVVWDDDDGNYVWRWLYIAAGDDVNRQSIAQAAGGK